MSFLSGSRAGCTSPATLAPVSGCKHAAFVLRRGAVEGLVLCFPSARACGEVAARVRAAQGLWCRARPVGRAWVLRVGVRSHLVERGVAVPVLLRAVAVRFAGDDEAKASALAVEAFAAAHLGGGGAAA